MRNIKKFLSTNIKKTKKILKNTQKLKQLKTSCKEALNKKFRKQTKIQFKYIMNDFSKIFKNRKVNILKNKCKEALNKKFRKQILVRIEKY